MKTTSVVSKQDICGYHGILPYLPPKIRKRLQQSQRTMLSELEEVRMRLHGYVWLRLSTGSVCLKEGDKAYACSGEVIRNALHLITASSLYALEEELRRGYVTLPGGHRVGLTGKAILEGGIIKSQRDISSIHYRIAKEIRSNGEAVIKHLYRGGSLANTLVFSPPGAGKTTLLRELTVLLSDGEGERPPQNVAVVDERSEIAATFLGVPQLYVGQRTDVLDGVPKAEGMMLMIRSMAPDVIVTDEIGSSGDKEAIQEAVNSGIAFVLSAHGRDLEEIRQRPVLRDLLNEHIFDRLICLSRRLGPGTIESIYDGNGKSIGGWGR